MIGGAHAEFLEEDVVEPWVVVLAGVDDHLLAKPVELLDDAAQADHLGPGAEDRDEDEE